MSDVDKQLGCAHSRFHLDLVRQEVCCVDCGKPRDGFSNLETNKIPADQATGFIAEALSDPWKHRSDMMRCRTCMWFAPKMPAKVGSDVPGLGRCRRHAPTMAGYPAVWVKDWCGDHKLDEGKL